MNDIELKFITDVIKPWDKLNILLSKRLVLEPRISDLTRITNDLARNIHHQIEYILKISNININDIQMKEIRKNMFNDNMENKIIGDVADTSKHFILRDKNRIADIELSSIFECDDNNKFRFIRNIAYIKYRYINQKYDFLDISYTAIKNLISYFNLNINFDRTIIENTNEFFDTAWLYLDLDKSISLKSANIHFLKKDSQGNLIPFNPKEIKFIVYNK